MKKFALTLAYVLGLVIIVDLVLRLWGWALDGTPIIRRRKSNKKSDEGNLKEKAEKAEEEKPKKKDKDKDKDSKGSDKDKDKDKSNDKDSKSDK